jgi:hypothetical protein
MDQSLVDVFEQARNVVADADRKIAEEEERRENSSVTSVLSLKLLTWFVIPTGA